jgi:F-box-like
MYVKKYPFDHAIQVSPHNRRSTLVFCLCRPFIILSTRMLCNYTMATLVIIIYNYYSRTSPTVILELDYRYPRSDNVRVGPDPGTGASIRLQHPTPHKSTLTTKIRTKYMHDTASQIAPPVTFLPPEILGEIFLESCTSPQNNDITDVNGTQSMVLASVCGRWREVALSTPELWSKFHFIPQDIDLTHFLVPLKLHLERSGNFPLTFIIIDEISLFVDKYDNLALYSLLDLIFGHAHHWGDATIFLNYNVYRQKLEEVEAFPVLHTFRAHELPYLTTNTFLRAPNLRHLEFTQSHVFPSGMELPWSQIVSVSIYHGLTNILEILHYATQLQHLKIYSAHTWGLEHSRSPNIFHLRSLYFCVANGEVDQFEALLHCVALPVAVRVEVELDKDPAVPMPHTAFIQFLARCKAVEELAVHRFEMTYDQLFQYPLIAPSITRLEATIGQDILTEEFKKAIDQLFAQCMQLTEVRILGYEEGFPSLVEFHAARLHTHGISTTITYMNAGLLF